MKMKKTWFSYPLWFLYAIVTGVLLAIYVSAVGMQLWGANQYTTAAFVALVFGAVAGVWLVGRKVAVYLNGRFAGDKHLANMWECFLVMGLTAAALLYRFRLLLHMDAVARGNGLYDMAIVKAGEGVPAMAHKASYVYTVFLSTVLSFTGNKAAVGVFLQLLLEIMVILVFYAGVRMLTGRTEAVCAMAVMTFSMDFCGEMFRLTPEVFYLVLYAVGILFLGMYGKRATMGRLLLIGVYSGLLGYLDLAGWALLLPGVYLCLNGAKTSQEKAWKYWMRPLVPIGLALVVMAGLCTAEALCAGESVGRILSEWVGVYAKIQGIVIPAGPDRATGLGLFVSFMAALAVFGFWFQEKQKQDIWILLLVVFSVLDMLNMGALRYEIFLTAIWGVLAGIGMTAMRVEMRSEDAVEKVPLKELVVEEITLEDETPKVQLIENPLPLPKKHVKKELDYDHQVDEDDDFDI